MIVHKNTILSDDLVNNAFVCDLIKCKGACCVEGDLGAPLEIDELKIMDEIIEDVKPFLNKAGLAEIEKQGNYIKDWEGDFSTPTINDKECAYSVYDEKGVLKCAIEDAYNAGKVPFKKPISCHLYPIRISVYEGYDALNYDRWSICGDACTLGEKLQVPVYKFLKDPLVRKYGEEWYSSLEEEIALRKQEGIL